MHKKAMPSMPDSTDLSSLCFQQKLKKNRLKFSTDNRKTEFISPPEIKCPLTCFEPCSYHKGGKKINPDILIQICALDLMPTSLLKSCADVLHADPYYQYK